MLVPVSDTLIDKISAGAQIEANNAEIKAILSLFITTLVNIKMPRKNIIP